MTRAIHELLNLAANQKMLDSFCEAMGISAAIIDLEGNVIIGSNWQSICVDFHRKNPITNSRCIDSDTILANNLRDNEKYSLYCCKNGLTDAASPIIIGDKHTANAFVGQFLLAPPNLDFFKKQAAQFDFDETEYLEALSKVPVIDKEKIPIILDFLVNYADLMATILLKHQSQLLAETKLLNAKEIISERIRYENELQKAHQHLIDEKIISDAVANTLPGIYFLLDSSNTIVQWNKNFEQVTGYTSDEIIALNPNALFDLNQPAPPERFILETHVDKAATIDIDLITKQQQIIAYSLTGTKVESTNENLTVVIGIDIS